MKCHDLKLDLLNCIAEFSWSFSYEFFMRSPFGNFIWNDPDYGGNNIMLAFNGSYRDFICQRGLPYTRDKGGHFVSSYCGNQFIVVSDPSRKIESIKEQLLKENATVYKYDRNIVFETDTIGNFVWSSPRLGGNGTAKIINEELENFIHKNATSLGKKVYELGGASKVLCGLSTVNVKDVIGDSQLLIAL